MSVLQTPRHALRVLRPAATPLRERHMGSLRARKQLFGIIQNSHHLRWTPTVVMNWVAWCIAVRIRMYFMTMLLCDVPLLQKLRVEPPMQHRLLRRRCINFWLSNKDQYFVWVPRDRHTNLHLFFWTTLLFSSMHLYVTHGYIDMFVNT
jgi:hypothetical protein